MCTIVLPSTDIMSAAENGAEEEEAPRVTKRKISLSNCVVCQSEEAKYRCPACLTHSCSLLCVKKHKEDSGCSGVRDKTAYVSLSQFDEMALLNDYRFLEDTGRFADGATRDNLIRTPHSTFKMKRLAASARKMNMTLKFLPITFSKSRENSTFFLSKEKRFMWHLKLIFPQSSTEFTQKRVSDGHILKQILMTYIHPTESDHVTRQKLKMYVQEPFDHVKVFMKVEGRKANSVRYHVLDVQRSLRDNLSYKTLVEYPVLHVVLKEHWKNYPQRGPAESTSLTKGEGVDQNKVDVTQVSPFLQQSPTTQATNIWTGTRGTRPESKPPQEKRAKTESGKEDVEEGEIQDSSEGEGEEGGDNDEENIHRPVDTKSPAGDMIKNEPGDIKDVNVDPDSSMNEDISAPTECNSAATVCAEGNMTKEDAVKSSGPVHTGKAADDCR
ncbi:hypothetical protein JOB18_025747 [Solea senegalensis]|uniref:Box C/D snoRNA protein 1 n=1 Tax=Solea senegalensis TaxID=28829 RepID=A0AAV6S8D6_SOLSE|nr:box C/D snoRNA protein 1 isoform X1 [Solea senegalensis]KAG7514120.1 hypothetical protein JOB18_025747 [Solea senegalensis]